MSTDLQQTLAHLRILLDAWKLQGEDYCLLGWAPDHTEVTVGGLRALVAALDWQPIDTVPRDGTWVELWWPALSDHETSNHIINTLRIVTVRWKSEYEEWADVRGTLYPTWNGTPTHWRRPRLEGPAGEHAP